MPFEVIESAEIEVGAPIKEELFTKIKNSLDDHELRLNSSEAGAARTIVFDHTVLNAASANTMTGLAYYEALYPFTVTGCEIRIFEKGSLAGSIEIDIKKSTSGLSDINFSTIFTTKPKVTLATAVDYERSSNQAFNPASVALSEGDTLRFDVTEMPSNGVMGKFRIILYGEV